MAVSPSPKPTPDDLASAADVAEQRQYRQRRVVQMFVLLVLYTVLGTVTTAITAEKTRFLLKEYLHLTATGQSWINAVTNVPAYVAPLVGTYVEMYPLAGWRRRGHYVVGTAVSAAASLLLAMTDHYTLALYVMATTLSGMGALWADVVVGAATVDVGNASGRYGQFQALNRLLPQLMAIAGLAHFGGYVAQHWSYREMFWIGGVFSSIIGLPLVFVLDDRRAGGADARVTARPTAADRTDRTDRAEARRQERSVAVAALKQAARSGGLWAVLAYFFLLNVTPWVGTGQTYYFSDALGLSKQAIGDLGMWGGIGGTLSTAVYLAFAHRASPRLLVWGSLVMGLMMYCSQLVIHDGASAKLGAVGVALATSLFYALLNTLIARACPKGIEGAIYGLMTATLVVSYSISDLMGSFLYDRFGPSHHYSIIHGWVWANGLALTFTLCVGLLIPFMPPWTRSSKALTDLTEAEMAMGSRRVRKSLTAESDVDG